MVTVAMISMFNVLKYVVCGQLVVSVLRKDL